MHGSLPGQLPYDTLPAHPWQYLACLLSLRPQLCFLVEGSWETWSWPAREKGPFWVPVKTQLLLKPNWAAFLCLTALPVSTFQMPSFNPEQKLLSD